MSAYDFYSQRVNNDLFIIYITRFLSEQNSKINISLFSLKGKQSAVKSPHSSRLALKQLPCKTLYNTHTRTRVRGCVCCDRRKKQRDYTLIPSLFVIALLSGDFVKYIRTIVYILYKFAQQARRLISMLSSIVTQEHFVSVVRTRVHYVYQVMIFRVCR